MGSKKAKGKYYHAKKKKYFAPKKAGIAEPLEANEAVERRESASFMKLFGSQPWWTQESSENEENTNEDGDDSSPSSPDDSCSSEDGDIFMESDSGCRLIDLEMLQAGLLAHGLCSACKSGGLVLTETYQYGLGSAFKLACDNATCHHLVDFPLSKKSRFYDVNR